MFFEAGKVMRCVAVAACMTQTQLSFAQASPPGVNPTIRDVVDAASFRPVLAPGGMFAIFGDNFAPGPSAADSLPLPINLGGIRVLANGRETPLFYISRGQVNGQLPYDIGAGEVSFIVQRDGVGSNEFVAIIRARAATVFQFPDGTCIAQRSDGSLVSSNNPIAAGDSFTVYTTGQGQVVPRLAAGLPAADVPLTHVEDRSRFSVHLNGQPVRILFFGLSPGLVSLGQLNVIAPTIERGGRANLSISSDGGLGNLCYLPATSFLGGEPQMEFTNVPRIGSNENLHGRVRNAPGAEYKVAVLIKVQNRWWTKPFADRPSTAIRPDGTWEADITTGGIDQQAEDVIAFLLNANFTVPIALGALEIPAQLAQAAVAKVSQRREPAPPPYRGRVSTPIVSSFDSGLEGWTGPGFRFASQIGNPPGALEYQELYSGDRVASSPEKFLGFWSHLDGGGFISFQHRVSSAGIAPAYWGAASPREIRLAGPGGAATWTGSVPLFNNGWVALEVKLDQAQWTVTSGTWRNLLDQITAFQIRGNLFNDLFGAERTQFDNVRLLAGTR
jgi:uncharacterized protein (TIGR03437 family)